MSRSKAESAAEANCPPNAIQLRATARWAVKHAFETGNSVYLERYLRGAGEVIPEMKEILADILCGQVKLKYRPWHADVPTPAMAKQIAHDIKRALRELEDGNLFWAKEAEALGMSFATASECTKTAIALAAKQYRVPAKTFERWMYEPKRQAYQRKT